MLVKELIQIRIQLALERQKNPEFMAGPLLETIGEQEEALNELENFEEKSERIPTAYFLQLYPWNEFERHIILLLVAFETEYRLTGLAALFHNNVNMGYVTPVLARETFEYKVSDNEMEETFCRDAPLYRLLLTWQENEKSPHFKMLCMDDRMRSFFLCGVVSYHSYESFLSPWFVQEKLSPLRDEQELLSSLMSIEMDNPGGKRLAVCLHGIEGVGKIHYCKHLARKMKWNLVLLKADALAAEEEEYQKQVNEYIRECSLLQAVPVIAGLREAVWKSEESKRRFRFLLQGLFSVFPLVYLTADAPIRDKSFYPLAEWIQLQVKEPSLLASHDIWEEEAQAYPLCKKLSLQSVINQFLLPPGKIKEALQAAARYASMSGREEIEEGDIRRGCFSLMEEDMGNRTVRIRRFFSWDQLILPKEQKDILLSAFHQIQYKQLVYENWGLNKTMAYGTGLSILLYGPPGTGKTMAAQVLARELGVELYRAQLAAIFSKYIGETEKNLQAIFEQARRNRMILFFDEADVLFSKRTEVRASNDKFSNLEAAFLLQKMEEYDGISILATNYYQNFDEAFKRRIQYLVEFPFPDKEARAKIWKTAIPSEMPIVDIDIEFLSKFELSGSHIKNIILQSAFAAAAKGEKVGMQVIMGALKHEFLKIGRSLSEEEAGEYYF